MLDLQHEQITLIGSCRGRNMCKHGVCVGGEGACMLWDVHVSVEESDSEEDLPK